MASFLLEHSLEKSQNSQVLGKIGIPYRRVVSIQVILCCVKAL